MASFARCSCRLWHKAPHCCLCASACATHACTRCTNFGWLLGIAAETRRSVLEKKEEVREKLQRLEEATAAERNRQENDRHAGSPAAAPDALRSQTEPSFGVQKADEDAGKPASTRHFETPQRVSVPLCTRCAARGCKCFPMLLIGAPCPCTRNPSCMPDVSLCARLLNPLWVCGHVCFIFSICTVGRRLHNLAGAA